MDDYSEHKVDDSNDGWVLDSEKVGEKESDIVSDSENDGNTAMLAAEIWVFLLGFSCPTPTLLLLAPILLWPGEATQLELLGTKRIKGFFLVAIHRTVFCP